MWYLLKIKSKTASEVSLVPLFFLSVSTELILNDCSFYSPLCFLVHISISHWLCGMHEFSGKEPFSPKKLSGPVGALTSCGGLRTTTWLHFLKRALLSFFCTRTLDTRKEACEGGSHAPGTPRHPPHPAGLLCVYSHQASLLTAASVPRDLSISFSAVG